MYFTDGYGEYPKKPTDYQIALFTGMTHRRKLFGRADKSAGLGSEIIFVRGYKRIDKGEIFYEHQTGKTGNK